MAQIPPTINRESAKNMERICPIIPKIKKRKKYGTNSSVHSHDKTRKTWNGTFPFAPLRQKLIKTRQDFLRRFLRKNVNTTERIYPTINPRKKGRKNKNKNKKRNEFLSKLTEKAQIFRPNSSSHSLHETQKKITQRTFSPIVPGKKRDK